MADRILVLAPNPGRIQAEILVRAPRLNAAPTQRPASSSSVPHEAPLGDPTVHPSRARPSPQGRPERSYLGSALRRPAHTASLPLDRPFVRA
jgi:hypothetical protein